MNVWAYIFEYKKSLLLDLFDLKNKNLIFLIANSSFFGTFL